MEKEELQKILSQKFGAIFPSKDKMKIILPKGGSHEDDCHTVSIEGSESGEVYIQCPTLKGCEENRSFSPEELIKFFDSYKKN